MGPSSYFRVQDTLSQTPQWRPTELMREAIRSLISRGALTRVAPCPQQFISTLFLVEKESGTGEFRPVINLKALNRFLPKEKFKMEGLHTARSLLCEGDYMMKLDLKDAYYAVPIHQESRKYLRFQFEGTTFEFSCLPFGLSLAPRVFTRILRPVVAKLRSEGIRTVIYLDDLLLIHRQRDTLTEIFHSVRGLLSSLGFLVNLKKRSPASTHRLIFLGAVLDTTQMSIALPVEQIVQIQGACREMLDCQSTSVGELSSLLGCMSHAARTGLWVAPLHYRDLQRQQARLLHRIGWKPKHRISLSPPSLRDLTWWVSPAPHSHNSPASSTSYSSRDGQHHCRRLREQEGGTQAPSLSLLALELWSFPLTHGSWVTARHLPGVLNVEAGVASREFNSRTEWMLRKDVFRDITHHFYVPEIDLFASRLNHQVPLCVSASRSRSCSSGRFPSRLGSVEEFHPTCSGAFSPNSSESEERQGNCPTSSPELAKTVMVRADPADADTLTVPTSQAEVTAVTTFR